MFLELSFCFLAVAMAIFVTGLALLLVFGNGSTIAGLAPGDFANAIYLTIFALLVGAALIARGMSGHCPMKAAMQGGDSQGWMSGGHSHDRLGGHDAREEGALDRAATQAM